ncbi:hypothetical protein C4566_01965 [Candidatus Parcubacteria bacterium]|nr:MAG: hypothetical protein C4566_01965 [Candidatus Parcubacteria bacterium]
MFGEKIIKLVQSDQVMEEFVNSEVKLQDINNQFYELTKEYKMSSNAADYYSFFNFTNVYFWFVLGGLLLLVFGLLYLLAELQQRSNNPKKVVKFSEEKKAESQEEEVVEVKVTKTEKEGPKLKEEEIVKNQLQSKKESQKKPIKVKVVKVK